MNRQIVVIILLPVLMLSVGVCAESIREVEHMPSTGALAGAEAALSSDTYSDQICRTVASGYAALVRGDYATASKSFSQLSIIQHQDLEAAAKTLETVGRRDSESWPIWLLKADLLAREGRYADAVSAATLAIEHSGGKALAYHIRGVIYGLAGESFAALENLNRAIRSDPTLADTYVARAIIRLSEGDVSGAKNDSECALRLAPFFASASNIRGVALCREGRHEDAIKAFVYALDVEPSFEAAAENIKTAKLLASPERSRRRIAIASGRRAGALGRRMLTVVVAEKNHHEQIVQAAVAAVDMATGHSPLVTTELQRAVRNIETGEKPVVLSLVPSLSTNEQSPQLPMQVVETIAKVGADKGEVCIITQGERSAVAMAKVLSQEGSPTNSRTSKMTILPPEWLRRWDIIDYTPADIDLNPLVTTVINLRSLGVEVRTYGGHNFIQRLLAELPEGSRMPIPLYVISNNSDLLESLAELSLPMCTSWMAPPEKNMRGGVQPCLCSTDAGVVGAFTAIPNLTPKGLKPGGVSTPAGGGTFVGVSRGGTPQITIVTGKEAVQIRLDIEDSHSDNEHVNVEAGGRNRHSNVNDDGGPPAQIAPTDKITIRVGGGKVVIEVNDEQVKEYEVPEAESDGETVIEHNPGGSTTVTQDDNPIGTIERRPDGSKVIKIGDTVIVVLPSEEGTGSNSGGEEVGTSNDPGSDSESEDDKGNNNVSPAVLPATILVGPGGVTVLPGPADGPIRPRPPYVTSTAPRGGVYTVDDSTLEITNSTEARSDLLFGAPRTNPKAEAVSLRYPFLIFQNTNVKE